MSGRRGNLPEPRVDDGRAGGVGHGVAGDGGEEVLALERVEPRVDGRRDGGGARDVSQQRDLAEIVGLVRARVAALDLDVEFALVDAVEAIAALAGPDE